MSFSLSISARRLSSVQRVLPPSITVSPASSSSPSFSTVCSVGSPAGTMIHTIRGFSSFSTISSSDPAPVAPWPSASPTASSLKSKPTTSWSESRWMRWTMFPPIFPSPTKPGCIQSSPPGPAGPVQSWSLHSSAPAASFASTERPALCPMRGIAGRSPVVSGSSDLPRQLPERRGRVPFQADPDHRQVVVLQRVEVADRLRVLQVAEGVARARDLHVFVAVVHELNEQAGGRTTLVELAGRVQEPRSVAEGGGGLGLVADGRPQLVHRGIELLARLEVAHDRHVVGRRRLVQDLAQVRGLRHLGQLAAVQHLLGVVLCLLHVRLIEGIDAERPARHRGG